MGTKVKWLILSAWMASMLLTACSSPASTAQVSGTAQPGGGLPGGGELSPITSLAIGILKLEETEQAVSAELLDLWQAYQALSNSETTAAVELEAVIAQIEAAMTPEQMQAIEAMALTPQSMAEAMQSLGIDFGSRGGSADGAQGTPEGGGDFEGFRGGAGQGGMPGGGAQGGGPGGGGMPGGGEVMIAPGDGQGFGAQVTPDASTQATMQARMNAQANRVNPMLLQALITMLETKAQDAE